MAAGCDVPRFRAAVRWASLDGSSRAGVGGAAGFSRAVWGGIDEGVLALGCCRLAPSGYVVGAAAGFGFGFGDGMPRADANACVSNDGPACRWGAPDDETRVFISSLPPLLVPCSGSLARPGGVVPAGRARGPGPWWSSAASTSPLCADASGCDGPCIGVGPASFTGAGGAAFSGSGGGLDMRKTSGAAGRLRAWMRGGSIRVGGRRGVDGKGQGGRRKNGRDVDMGCAAEATFWIRGGGLRWRRWEWGMGECRQRREQASGGTRGNGEQQGPGATGSHREPQGVTSGSTSLGLVAHSRGSSGSPLTLGALAAADREWREGAPRDSTHLTSGSHLRVTASASASPTHGSLRRLSTWVGRPLDAVALWMTGQHARASASAPAGASGWE